MTSTPAEMNQKIIIALRPRGNNSESAGWSIWSVRFNQIDETDQINQIDRTQARVVMCACVTTPPVIQYPRISGFDFSMREMSR